MKHTSTLTGHKPHLLKDKSFDFAIRMVKLYAFLTAQKKEFIISKQILRSGTSPGAMVREALNAESSHDFIHKLGIAQKEIGETQYWLELLHAVNYINDLEFRSLYADSQEIMKITRSTILTKKKNIAIKTSLLVICMLTLTHFLFN